MKITLIEPYFSGSHASWAKEYAENSRHDIRILSLPGKYWKWRMHGGAVTLAQQFMNECSTPDLLLATDMLDLTTFLALTREKTASIKTALYFHENQLTYPWAPTDDDPSRQRDRHYSFINYTSALAADRVFFNSRYNLESYLNELPRFLKKFPDKKGLQNVENLRRKSSVLPLGLDLKQLDPAVVKKRKGPDSRPPLILWNHRWEYDKNPEEFFAALFRLAEKGVAFEVAILGEAFSRKPPVFEEAQKILGRRIVHCGFAESFSLYASWLWKADILPVTSVHDFFGISVVQAMYCDCYPLLPKRLAYPEHIPQEFHDMFFYNDCEDLLLRLEKLILDFEKTKNENIQPFVNHYDWHRMGPVYDTIFEKIVSCQDITK